jgi:hypothetical protein
MKLTKPQEQLLRELERGVRYVADQSEPGRRLLAIGFAYDTGWRNLEITDAGRRWIKEMDAK